MSNEDNKHIEIFKEEVKREQIEYENVNEYTKFFYNNHKIILNIINKLQKENEKLKLDNQVLRETLYGGNKKGSSYGSRICY